MSTPVIPEVIHLSDDDKRATALYESFVSNDSPLAEYLATGKTATPDPDIVVSYDLPFEPLERSLTWAGGLGWLKWDGKRWASISRPGVVDIVRVSLRSLFLRAAGEARDARDLQTLKGYLAAGTINRVTDLLQGILESDPADFDTEHDLLNCRNGVVDLKTGELLPHDAAYKFTKITRAAYGVNTSHPDWTKALKALPADSRGYMQVRYGQAITGHTVADDKLIIQQGGGRNAKSTLMNGVVNALGDFAGYIPETVLTGGSGHPTDVMTLRGLRVAMLEELPEGKQLPTKKLKDLQGTQTITGRYMRQDFVTFAATHALFVNTNYVPKVTETDHGTWERLALIRFPYTYIAAPDVILDPEREREADPGLRERIKQGDDDVWDAVLFWLVQGAVRWYENGHVMPRMPLTIATDTAAWRAEADLILAYASERLVFDPEFSVSGTELAGDFSVWLAGQGHSAWSAQTFADRFGSHKMTERAKVTRATTRDHARIARRHADAAKLPDQVRVWRGVRFRRPVDES